MAAKSNGHDTPEHFDVLVVGAGISGVGAAYHMTQQCPGKSFVVLDKMESFGGTWLCHTYPGIRSDSDLYTFGYRFKPWIGPPIATAEEILTYMNEVIDENGLDKHIRYNHKILKASWSSVERLWTLTVELGDGQVKTFTGNFLWMCQGYYDHEKGYTPDWPGLEDFEGEVIHPQTWPEDADLKGKEVVVIGSGATTATVVPAIAGDCKHVTVLQRSPTYFIPGSNANELADTLRQIELDDALIHEIVRKKALFDQEELTRRSREEPEVVKEELLAAVREFLGPDYDIDKHFTPHYRPWQQRVAFIPDGDLFQGIAAGAATMVTDHIDHFTKDGIVLKSGDKLNADVVVTATGFNLSIMGGIPFEVDGKAIDFADTLTYRGMMFTGVPNMVWIFGYFRASWTLRVDMVSDFVCALLNKMDKEGIEQVEVRPRAEDADMEVLPWGDPEDFNPGYLMRSGHLLPKRGTKREWQHTQDYWREREEFPAIDLAGEEFVYD